MPKIISKRELVPSIFEMEVHHPPLAAKAEPGHFVMVMESEEGERIPLTIADFDRDRGTITMVIMAIGTSTKQLCQRNVSDELYSLIGPLGHASEIESFGRCVMVAGGVGAAPIYPIARRLAEVGNEVITIQGARHRGLLFWEDKLAAVSSQHIVTTDDGSAGRRGLVTEPLREILEAGNVGVVYAIGPAIMMKFCAETCRPFGVKTIASLNSVMIDGTGMCGGCRVRVGGETKFTCVDGPEFDALGVDWDILLARQKTYCEQEKCSLQRYANVQVS
ncbi:MAG: sulfide/dihydroorotate dehydrogenase-like FAD/NAD-binding protein [Thermoguttaceae bacterium]